MAKVTPFYDCQSLIGNYVNYTFTPVNFKDTGYITGCQLDSNETYAHLFKIVNTRNLLYAYTKDFIWDPITGTYQNYSKFFSFVTINSFCDAL